MNQADLNLPETVTNEIFKHMWKITSILNWPIPVTKQENI